MFIRIKTRQTNIFFGKTTLVNTFLVLLLNPEPLLFVLKIFFYDTNVFTSLGKSLFLKIRRTKELIYQHAVKLNLRALGMKCTKVSVFKLMPKVRLKIKVIKSYLKIMDIKIMKVIDLKQ